MQVCAGGCLSINFDNLHSFCRRFPSVQVAKDQASKVVAVEHRSQQIPDLVKHSAK